MTAPRRPRTLRLGVLAAALLATAALCVSLLPEAPATSAAPAPTSSDAAVRVAAPQDSTAAARAAKPKKCKKPPKKCRTKACRKKRRKCRAKATTPVPTPTVTTPAPTAAPVGPLTYTLARAESPTADQLDAYARITAAMDAAVRRYNTYAAFQRHLNVSYAPGVPTAEGGGNDIRFGSNRGFMTERTALHEMGHTVGVGSSGGWFQICSNHDGSGTWTGTQARALVKSWDGPTAEITCGGRHIWPYGLNYDNEFSEVNANRHVMLMAAMVRDGQ